MEYIIKDYGIGEVDLKNALLNIINEKDDFELTLNQLRGSIIDLLKEYDFDIYIQELSNDIE